MKNNSELLRLWIEKAESDLFTAKHLLELKASAPTEIICFHAQQSAEKFLKACLIKNDLEILKTHNLTVLINELNKTAKGFSKLLKIAAKLTPYAVEARYPGAYEGISLKEAKLAVNYSETIKKTCIKTLTEKAANKRVSN